MRGMTQDDAHIFCRPDQVVEEVNGVLDLNFHLLETLGFSEFDVMLSTRPEKAVGEPEQWELATESLRQTLEQRGIHFEVDEGGGAFLRPQDRHSHPRRHRQAMAMHDRSVRFQPAGSVSA